MRVVILGTGGHGRVIKDIVSYNNNFEIIGFIDDRKEFWNNKVEGLNVLGGFSALEEIIKKEKIEGILLGIGDNKIRATFYEKSKELGLKLPNAIHPSSIISKNVKFGEATVIMAGVIINTSSYIGNDVVINTGAQLDHDNYVGDHAHIYPGAVLAGAVRVGKYSYIGMNATIRENLTIGNNSFIGMGAVVTKNVPDSVMVYGNPAKFVRNLK